MSASTSFMPLSQCLGCTYPVTYANSRSSYHGTEQVQGHKILNRRHFLFTGTQCASSDCFSMPLRLAVNPLLRLSSLLAFLPARSSSSRTGSAGSRRSLARRCGTRAGGRFRVMMSPGMHCLAVSIGDPHRPSRLPSPAVLTVLPVVAALPLGVAARDLHVDQAVVREAESWPEADQIETRPGLEAHRFNSISVGSSVEASIVLIFSRMSRAFWRESSRGKPFSWFSK